MNPSIDSLLIAARTHQIKDGFTHAVMQNISNLPTPPREKKRIFTYIRSLQPAYLMALFVITLVALSGISYATYRLWIAPQVSVMDTERNDRGNQEFTLSLQNCNFGATGLEATKEMDVDEVDKHAHAECERSAVQDWARTEWKYITESTTLSTSSVSTFDYTDHDTIFFSEGYIKEATISQDTKVIIDGVEGRFSDIERGDTIILVERLHYGPERGHPMNREVLALVKVALPLKYYDLSNQARLRRQFTCFGTLEQCVDHPMIEVYSTGTPGDAALQAKVIEIADDRHLTLEARSGAKYHLEVDPAITREFNDSHAPQYYKGHAVKEGVWLDISFMQDENSPNTISPDQLRIMHIFTNSSNPKDEL